jgi:hypothetical protein
VLVLGVALGFLLGWLNERSWAVDLRLRAFNLIAGSPCLRRLARAFLIVLLLAGLYLLAFADYDDNSYMPTSAVRAFHFATSRRLTEALLSFLLGWLFFSYRKPLRVFARKFGETLTSGRAEPQAAGEIHVDPAGIAKPPAVAAATAIAPERRLQSWIANGAAATIAVAAVFIAIVIAQPGIFSHIESVKFGDIVEARFAAANEHSVRVSMVSFGGPLTAHQVLLRGTELPEVIKDILTPTDKLLSARLTEAKRDQASKHRERAFLFLKVYAVPLAQVVTCYLKEYPIGETEIVQQAVVVANRLSRMATGADTPSPGNYDALDTISNHLLEHIHDKLPPNQKLDTSGYEFYVPAKKDHCDLRRPELPPDWRGTIRGHIGEILQNGIVISFIANLVAFTQDFETAAKFLERANKLADDGTTITGGDATAQFIFYYTLTSAKYFARWHPRASIKSDFDTALSTIDTILLGISEAQENDQKKDAPKLYFMAERARLINNRLYYLLNESLQGRTLRQTEVDEIKALAYELKRWITTQQAGLYETKPGGIAELVNKRRAGLIPPMYDTLATEQIVVAQMVGKATEKQCAQVRIYLDKAEDLFSELARQNSEGDYRDDLKIVEARRNMRDSICVADVPG